MYKPLLSRLADIVQIVYVDHRGNGRSGRLLPEEYTLANTVEDLEALRQYLGLGKIILYGSSYGGMVSLCYATTYPENVSRVIVSSTAPSYEWCEEGRREAYRRATPMMKPELDRLFEARYESPEQMRKSFSVLDPLYSHSRYNREKGEEGLDHVTFSPDAINWAFSIEIKQHYDVREKLSHITAPTLIIAGRHDWAMHPRQQELMHKNTQFTVGVV